MSTRALLVPGLALALLALPWVPLRPAYADEPLTVPPQAKSKSGYDRIASLGGPDSVAGALRHHDTHKETFYRGHVLEDLLAPYYCFKKRLKDRYGLALGMDYNVLYQRATAGLTADEAASGAFRFYFHWDLVGRGTPTHGAFVFRVENRHTIGGGIGATHLGKAIGSLFSTANSFSDWRWGVTNCQWQQLFKDGRYAFAFGQIDIRDWLDVFDLSNWRTALLGEGVTFPVNHLPSAGLGAAAHAFPLSCNTPFVGVGIGDANGHPDKWGFETFFDTREYYSFVELGWTPSFERRIDDHVRFTYWHQDRRSEKGTPEGWGLNFSAAWKFDEKWAPFVRGGWAEGGVAKAKAAVLGGLGIHRRSHDLFGVALGWATPWEDGLRDQISLETFYRLQISQNVGITPDVEVIFDPSNNPDEDVIFVFGIRAQLVL